MNDLDIILADCLSYDLADSCIRLGRADLVDACIACDWRSVSREIAATLCADATREEHRATVTAAAALAEGNVEGAARILADVRDDEMTLDAYAVEVLAEMAAAAASGVDRTAGVSL